MRFHFHSLRQIYLRLTSQIPVPASSESLLPKLLSSAVMVECCRRWTQNPIWVGLKPFHSDLNLVLILLTSYVLTHFQVIPPPLWFLWWGDDSMLRSLLAWKWWGECPVISEKTSALIGADIGTSGKDSANWLGDSELEEDDWLTAGFYVTVCPCLALMKLKLYYRLFSHVFTY